MRREISVEYLLRSLWGAQINDGTSFHPLCYQFWFIRDLMVTVVLTPVIYFLCKYLKIYGVVLLGLLWYCGLWPEYAIKAGLSSGAVFFFTAGAYFGIYKRNTIVDFSRIKILSFVLYPMIALADLLTKQYEFNRFIDLAGIIVGIVFCFNLAAVLLESGKTKTNKFWTSASFFVFAVHEPFLLAPLVKVTYVLIKPETDMVVTALYFLNVIVVVLASLGLYCLLRRFLPKFTAVITGGRVLLSKP